MTTYILAWFPMLLIAILNGALREAVIKKWFADAVAHRLSTLTLVLFFAVYIYFIIRRFPLASVTQAMVVGLMWMIMTLIFEFGFGRYRGLSWESMLADYNILQGKLWLLVPLWVLLAPFVFYQFTNRTS